MQDKRLESQQYFLMFGGGSRLCPGKELGIVEITTFIHYFVTRYRYNTQFSLIVFFQYLISLILCRMCQIRIPHSSVLHGTSLWSMMLFFVLLFSQFLTNQKRSNVTLGQVIVICMVCYFCDRDEPKPWGPKLWCRQLDLNVSLSKKMTGTKIRYSKWYLWPFCTHGWFLKMDLSNICHMVTSDLCWDYKLLQSKYKCHSKWWYWMSEFTGLMCLIQQSAFTTSGPDLLTFLTSMSQSFL